MEQPLSDEKKDLLLAELALVGVDVLEELFGFSAEQLTLWLDETLSRIEKKYAIHIKKSANIL